MINIKNIDPNKITIDEKSKKKNLIYHLGYVTVKDPIYATFNSRNPLYLIIDKRNGYIEESNKNKYFTLDHTDESKKTLKKYKGQWSKI